MCSKIQPQLVRFKQSKSWILFQRRGKLRNVTFQNSWSLYYSFEGESMPSKCHQMQRVSLCIRSVWQKNHAACLFTLCLDVSADLVHNLFARHSQGINYSALTASSSEEWATNCASASQSVLTIKRTIGMYEKLDPSTKTTQFIWKLINKPINYYARYTHIAPRRWNTRMNFN